jgi:hypothetical protein
MVIDRSSKPDCINHHTLRIAARVGDAGGAFACILCREARVGDEADPDGPRRNFHNRKEGRPANRVEKPKRAFRPAMQGAASGRVGRSTPMVQARRRCESSLI